MAKRTLHFNQDVDVSPFLDTLIAADPAQQKDIHQFYIEHRKAVRQQADEAHRIEVKHGFDTPYILKTGVKVVLMSKVMKVTERDVFVETTAMSLAEYGEVTRKLVLSDYNVKRQPPIH